MSTEQKKKNSKFSRTRPISRPFSSGSQKKAGLQGSDLTIQDALITFRDMRILVIGDMMLDQYTHGTVTRVSPEAPIPVLSRIGAFSVPGGAANVARNAAQLGAQTALVGVVGKDPAGTELLTLLAEAGIDTDGCRLLYDRPTTEKHRFVSDDHQLLRVDNESAHELAPTDEEILLRVVRKKIVKTDIVILSDYAKGVFSAGFAKAVIEVAARANVPVVADIKPKNKTRFKGVALITPNEYEALTMTGAATVEEAGKRLVKELDTDVVVTRGEHGMLICAKGKRPVHVAAKEVKVSDITGAGDTAVATLAVARASGLDLIQSVMLANMAAGAAVSKPGTATVSLEELETLADTSFHRESAYAVTKLWGKETWLENNEKYCCKILTLKKGFQCSLHRHAVKDEMFLVIDGHVRLEAGERVLEMREGHFVRIQPGVLHRFRGIEDSTIIEVSTHHDDADSYRVEESRKAA